jgi:anti-sigma B factor antagonist
VVLSVSGTVDMLTASTMEAAISTELDKQPVALIVDLTDVEFLASHGLRVLIDAHDGITGDTAFLIVADGPVTARPLTLMGITEFIAVYPTLHEALLKLAA